MPQAFTTTFVLWTGDGNTTQFGFSFQYQRPEDVFVEVDDNPVPTVLVTSNTVQVLPAPAMNARIRIFRSTPVQEPANQFQLGAPFLPANIDENFEQGLFVLQEGLEIIDEQVKFIESFSVAVTTAVSLLQAEVSGFEADFSTLQTEMSGVEADLLTLQGQHGSLAASAIRAPVGESVPALPPAAQRIGKIMGFDGAGDPALITGSDASSLAAALADWNQGGNLVGYDAARSVRQALDEALTGEILIADVTGLQNALDSRAAVLHTHGIPDVTGLQAALDNKAALAHLHTLADVADAGTAASRNTGTGPTEIPTNADLGPLNAPHTWAVAGEVKVPVGDADVIPGFFVPTLAPGQTVKLVEARHVIGSGTSATVKLRRNGVDIAGFTGMSVTPTAALTNPADIALAAGDYIQPVVTAVSGTPKNLTLTIALEYGRA